MEDDNIWCASFDLGKKNFAFYIEEFSASELNNLIYIKKENRYKKDGTPTDEFSEILKKVCINGKNILFRNVDLTVGCDKSKKGNGLDPEILHNMNDLLDDYLKYWDYCSFFVIERQMQFNKKYNTIALKLAQHCWSYFSFKYGRFKHIIDFPAYYKTQILGAKKVEDVSKKKKKDVICYKTMDKPARKKWSEEKAMSILREREDWLTLSDLSSVKKRDDLADVLCQLQSFKVLYYIDKIREW